MWETTDAATWRAALDSYDAVIARQGSARLPAHDGWYHHLLPTLIAQRTPPSLTHESLVRLTEWKMARGVWRARNLHLVRSNSAQQVEAASVAAFAAIPHPTKPISALAKLSGVGPATASAALAAFAPDRYPFFDEIVARQVAALGAVKFTLGYYARYAQALSERAVQLGSGWTPAMVERALYAHVGGKAGTVSHPDRGHDG